MNQEFSLPRRIARAVYVGLGAISLILALANVMDPAFRYALLNHDLGSRDFKEAAIGFGLWVIMGSAFLVGAYFIKNATPWILLVITFGNALFFAWLARTGGAGKEIALTIPLGLSLVALLFEDFKILWATRRNTA